MSVPKLTLNKSEENIENNIVCVDTILEVENISQIKSILGYFTLSLQGANNIYNQAMLLKYGIDYLHSEQVNLGACGYAHQYVLKSQEQRNDFDNKKKPRTQLKEKRESQGLSQKELALCIGVADTHKYALFEMGVSDFGEMKKQRLMDALNIHNKAEFEELIKKSC